MVSRKKHLVSATTKRFGSGRASDSENKGSPLAKKSNMDSTKKPSFRLMGWDATTWRDKKLSHHVYQKQKVAALVAQPVTGGPTPGRDQCSSITGVVYDELTPEPPTRDWSNFWRSVGLRVGSWNVGTMKGKSAEIADELWRRRVDVCALQETRWKGGSAQFLGAKGRRYKFVWQGGDGNGGVGIMIKEDLVSSIIEVRRRSDRVIVVVIGVGKVVV